MTQTEGTAEVTLAKETENGSEAPPPVAVSQEIKVKVDDSSIEEKILRQVEFYFGDANLPIDKFIKLESAKHDGWFPVELLLTFNKLMGIVSSVPEEERLKTVVAGIQGSMLVEVNEDGTKMRRNPDVPLPEGSLESRTIYLKGFNKTETKLDTLIDYFSKYEGMQRVIMRYYKEKLLLPPEAKTEENTEKKAEETTEGQVAPEPDCKPKVALPTSASDKIIWVKKFKGSIFVVFKNEELAKAALADISTYGGHPLMKMSQPDYIAMKKLEYQERVEKKRKNAEEGGSPSKKPKEEAVAEEPTVKGVLVKISEIPDGTTREVIKECWYKATGDKEKFDISFVDFVRGNKDGVIRLTNDGAAAEALGLDSLKEGKLPLNDGASLKVALFADEAEEKACIQKMLKDKSNFNNRGGRSGGRGRGHGRRGGRGRRR